MSGHHSLVSERYHLSELHINALTEAEISPKGSSLSFVHAEASAQPDIHSPCISKQPTAKYMSKSLKVGMVSKNSIRIF